MGAHTVSSLLGLHDRPLFLSSPSALQWRVSTDLHIDLSSIAQPVKESLESNKALQIHQKSTYRQELAVCVL